ncbi:MAG: SRPBCC family protein [Candidatus Thermoplasmatota archaeon]|nr:SRPBCC family protein [Candidatus Thermoplasmatota archaeon]
MAKGESEKSGGEYSASVRRKQKTKLKAKKHWSLRRVAAVVGFIAASLAVLAFSTTFFPIPGAENIFGRMLAIFRLVRETINDFFASFINIPLPAPLIGLGDIVIVAVIVALLIFLLRVAEPDVVRKIDEMMMVMRTRTEAVRKKDEAQKEVASETPAPPPFIPFPMAYPSQGRQTQNLQFSASAVVNAPRAQVWEVLNQVVYVPTCGEILDSVEVLGKLANSLTWEGTIRAGRKEFPVEGTTTLYPPTRMEVACHRGALQGFRGVLSLVDVPGGTRLTETAEFDVGAIPDEYAPVANTLRAKGSEILIRDLEHFDQLVQALASPKGEPETPE